MTESEQSFVEYLGRQAEHYARLARAQEDEFMVEYMLEKVAAYRDAMHVYGLAMPVVPTLDTIATVQNYERPTYASELRAILRTIPR